MKIAVIGAGPGGYEAALYAAKRGAEVVLIEKEALGGTCLNRGCIPTKAFLASLDTLKTVKDADDFGININGEIGVDYQAVVARKNKIMQSLVKGIEFLCKKNGVRVINGVGRLKSTDCVEVIKADGSVEEIDTDYIILATGSVPVRPAIFNIDGKRVITSDEALELSEPPKSMILVGGGVIGSEIGQFFAGMGTQMTVVEALPRLMATMDEDVSKQLARQFKKDKIKVICGDGISEVKPEADGVKVTLNSGNELSAECVLVAVGRAPYTEGLGLENAGVRLTDRGRVDVNEYLQTSAENIYAIGDITESAQLAHVASKEGFTAVDNIFGEKKAMSYHAVPGCVFTEPEIASVGTLEWQLQKAGKEAGRDYKTGSFDFKALGKAQASGHISGFVKVICDMDAVLIGAEIVGARASDMLQVLTVAVQLRLTAKQLLESIYPHPTMCEGIAEALHDVYGMSTMKV